MSHHLGRANLGRAKNLKNLAELTDWVNKKVAAHSVAAEGTIVEMPCGDKVIVANIHKHALNDCGTGRPHTKCLLAMKGK